MALADVPATLRCQDSRLFGKVISSGACATGRSLYQNAEGQCRCELVSLLFLFLSVPCAFFQRLEELEVESPLTFVVRSRELTPSLPTPSSSSQSGSPRSVPFPRREATRLAVIREPSSTSALPLHFPHPCFPPAASNTSTRAPLAEPGLLGSSIADLP